MSRLREIVCAKKKTEHEQVLVVEGDDMAMKRCLVREVTGHE